jgi:hypothetical protein
VNVGAAYHVFREHGLRHLDRITRRLPALGDALQNSAASPDPIVEALKPGGLLHERSRGGVETGFELAGTAG